MIRTEPSAPVLRDRFANLEGSTYLISHSMGAAPLAAREALVSYWNDWSHDGPEAWDWWLPQIETIAAGIGSLLRNDRILALVGDKRLHQHGPQIWHFGDKAADEN